MTRHRAEYTQLLAPDLQPILPVSVPAATYSGHSHSVSHTQSVQANTGTIQRTVSSQASPMSLMSQPSGSRQAPVTNPSKAIYCCVDIPYSEPVEKRFYSVAKIEHLQDDEELYIRVQNVISAWKGTGLGRWLFHSLYWKSCTQVEFIKVCDKY